MGMPQKLDIPKAKSILLCIGRLVRPVGTKMFDVVANYVPIPKLSSKTSG